MNITEEQWVTLDKIADTCKDARAYQLEDIEDYTSDDWGLYVLMTGFMFLYNKVKKEENLQ